MLGMCCMPGKNSTQQPTHDALQVMRVLQQQQMLEAAHGTDNLPDMLHSSPGLVVQSFTTYSALPFCNVAKTILTSAAQLAPCHVSCKYFLSSVTKCFIAVS